MEAQALLMISTFIGMILKKKHHLQINSVFAYVDVQLEAMGNSR